MIKILSIDGGGVLGVLPCMILAWFAKHLLGGEPIGRKVDIFVGTSTGGVIVLGLGQGRSVRKFQMVWGLFFERGDRRSACFVLGAII